MKIKLILLLCVSATAANAQESLQFFRPNDPAGANIFEMSKKTHYG